MISENGRVVKLRGCARGPRAIQSEESNQYLHYTQLTLQHLEEQQTPRGPWIWPAGYRMLRVRFS